MNPRIPTLVLAAAVALTAAPAADAAKKKPRLSATYMVTLHAELDAKWQYHDHSSIECEVGVPCPHNIDGAGSEKTFVKTKKPFPMLVSRGAPGRPPVLNLGSDGIAVTGSSLVQGTLTSDYEGPWAAANPDTSEPTDDCGPIAIDDFASIGWDSDSPSSLSLQVSTDPLRMDCPTGPPSPMDWANDESPSLSDVLAPVGKGKFLGTKQFTVRGAKTFTAVTPATNLPHKQVNGDASATWQWEATFRMKGAKKTRK